MSVFRVGEVKRGRPSKVNRNIARIYKEGKCRECSVVVTRMDFAKILGKFTKVKIQYKSTTTPETNEPEDEKVGAANVNARLKSNENGMVLLHRTAYKPHPVTESTSPKKPTTPTKTHSSLKATSPSNILKENNRLKKSPITKDKNSNYNEKQLKTSADKPKQYSIVFIDPTVNGNDDGGSKITLADVIPLLDKSVLPSDNWVIELLPKEEVFKPDHVYDRIAAELEDLMYNEKRNLATTVVTESIDCKAEEFPSIMDILNDNASQITHEENSVVQEAAPIVSDVKSSLESSDVEAMLLDNSDVTNKSPEPLPMDVDNSEVNRLIEDVVQLGTTQNISPEIVDNESNETETVPAVNLDTSIGNVDSVLSEEPCDISPVTKAEPEDTEKQLDPVPEQESSVATEAVSILGSEPKIDEILEAKGTEDTEESQPTENTEILENSAASIENIPTEINSSVNENTDVPMEEDVISNDHEDTVKPDNVSLKDEERVAIDISMCEMNGDLSTEEETSNKLSDTVQLELSDKDDQNSTVLEENCSDSVPLEQTIASATEDNEANKVDSDKPASPPNETIADSVGPLSPTIESNMDSVASPSPVEEIVKVSAKPLSPLPENNTDIIKSENSHSKRNAEDITHAVFMKIENDICCRLVKCSKNLKYNVEIEGKIVELIGAPKIISCLEDLQVMLQIVNDSDLGSFNVVH